MLFLEASTYLLGSTDDELRVESYEVPLKESNKIPPFTQKEKENRLQGGRHSDLFTHS